MVQTFAAKCGEPCFSEQILRQLEDNKIKVFQRQICERAPNNSFISRVKLGDVVVEGEIKIM